VKTCRRLFCLIAAAAAALLCLNGAVLAQEPSASDALQQPEQAQSELDKQGFPSGSSGPTCETLNGTWQGKLHTSLTEMTYFDDPIELNFIDDANQPRMYLTIRSYESAYTIPQGWSVGTGTVSFSFNEGPWVASVYLEIQEDGATLVGTYSQYGREYPLVMKKTSDEPVMKYREPQFTFEEKGIGIWQGYLKDYATFGTGGNPIPFTYELLDRQKTARLLAMADFEGVANGTYNWDTELMRALLEQFCDTFRHDGASGMPEQTDLDAILDHAIAKGGIECRGLSAMFSAILRAYGIPAKPVMCLPYTDPCEDCHVLVHAWSYDMGKWVLIDPTYRLMLRDVNGVYLGIPEVRQAFVNGDVLVPNETAGHNLAPFSLEYYRAYMTKNMFRFSCLTSTTTAGETSGNRTQMLVPLNYQIQYPWSRPETITRNATSFWAPPVVSDPQGA